MPWQPADAESKNGKVKSPAQKKKWATIANSVLARTGDDGQAIRIANAKFSELKKLQKS